MVPFLVGFAALIWYFYYKYPWIIQDFKLIAVLARGVLWIKKCERTKTWLVDCLEEHAKKIPTKTFLIFEKQKFSYDFVNQQTNKVANFALAQGWKCGDVVALCIHNEPAFVWTYLGLSKCGIVSAFINTNLRAKSLQHSLQVSNAKAVIVGQSKDLQAAIKDVQSELDSAATVYAQGNCDDIPAGWCSFDELVNSSSDDQPKRSIRRALTHRSSICYIYTSGTTGLPKPALIAQDRVLRGATIPWACGFSHDDVLYVSLPLYHSAASLAALGGTIKAGATLVLRSKFSASQFWNDCRENNVTAVQYIGELCRFLISRPKTDKDQQHSVRLAFGNGLRADIWPEFQKRFAIRDVVDFYAATEGNVGFINLFNKQGSIGRCSPLLKLLMPVKLVKYDFDTAQPVRDAHGRCIEVKSGEPGLMVCLIKRDLEFDGYVGKKELTNTKILRNVFKEGDAYFNSGDLIYEDKEHYLYFSDRIGDTFRWKGENVSTTEVSNVLCDIEWIEDANVYGISIPGSDGKCGMAALTLKEGHGTVSADDLQAVYRHCEDYLAMYARPRFLRLQREMVMTATFKQQKFTLVKEGFNPDLIHDGAVYYLDTEKKTFSLVNSDVFEAINSGQIRL